LIAGPIERSSRPEKVVADIGVSSSFSDSAAVSFFAMTGIAVRATTMSRIQIRFIGLSFLSEKQKDVPLRSLIGAAALSNVARSKERPTVIFDSLES